MRSAAPKRPSIISTSILTAAALVVGSVAAVSASDVDNGNATPTATTVAADPFDSGLGVYEPRPAQCVLFDTRGGTKIDADSTRTFTLDNPTIQGGEPNCVVPDDAIGAHVNLVAILPDGFGNLKIFGASETTEPEGGIVNFSPQQPNLNNSNAFVMDQDPTGWTVRSNGGPVHVRAVLYGFYFDGGQTFAATDHDHEGVYAEAGHDHAIAQGEGTNTDVSDTTTVSEVELDLGTQCPAGSDEVHTALVTYTGTLNQDLLSLTPEVELELHVDGTEVEDAALSVEVTNVNVNGRVPVSRTWLLDDLAPGSHTITVVADPQNFLPIVGSVNVEIDVLAESRGWTC